MPDCGCWLKYRATSLTKRSAILIASLNQNLFDYQLPRGVMKELAPERCEIYFELRLLLNAAQFCGKTRGDYECARNSIELGIESDIARCRVIRSLVIKVEAPDRIIE